MLPPTVQKVFDTFDTTGYTLTSSIAGTLNAHLNEMIESNPNIAAAFHCEAGTAEVTIIEGGGGGGSGMGMGI